MERPPSWIISISLAALIVLLINSVTSEETDVRLSLIRFLEKLSSDGKPELGWNASSDPCLGGWTGVSCSNRTNTVRSIVLEDLKLDGSIDAALLCEARKLMVLSLANNSLRGELSADIANCTKLTHLYLSRNQLSGTLPSALSDLSNLKRLDISNNNFSGELPNLPRISGLLSVLAKDNSLNGSIPPFNFANLQEFDVSGNHFTGQIPEGADRLGPGGFSGNPGLCGKPLPIACPPGPTIAEESKKHSTDKAIMYSGYVILGLAFILFITYKIVKRYAKAKMGEAEKKKGKKKKKKSESPGKGSTPSSDHNKGGTSRSEYSIGSSTDSVTVSTSLIVLSNPTTIELTFEELLKAPAELVGRGRFGSLYKVLFENEIALAVKRIKDYTVSAGEFRRRMERVDRLKHPNVLPPIAFYCSNQEKLVVYEYQQNGSLFNMIHGGQGSQVFDWSSRLNVAAGIAEGMAFMHRELGEERTGHGNLKSSNILMDSNMCPCISEYGVIDVALLNSPSVKPPVDRSASAPLLADVNNFGIILLELLTGKLVHNNGFDLPQWVNSVVREEWTAEVFDKVLLADCASEERMVHLLQVALKCIEDSPGGRPSMSEVAAMINSIREEEDRSANFEV